MIVVLAQTKGGVGKTTLAVNLAIERTLRGRRDVLLVDADEQGTAADFSALRVETRGATGYTAVQLTGAAVRSQVLAMRGKYDDVVIDAGGRDTTGLRAALTIADVAVVPFQPRSFDVWTLGKVGQLLADARVINPNLRAYAIINCADPQGEDNRSAAEALTEHPEIEFMRASIGRRKAFPNAAAAGLSVLEAPHPDSKACNELKILADRLFAQVEAEAE
ncbi:MAG: AAA family ATPase [Alphaproteobacteria bacterium]|nr:AAA family ATPase [Alphaproteobacteria bacterium]